jgi:hypothetical protein
MREIERKVGTFPSLTVENIDPQEEMIKAIN